MAEEKKKECCKEYLDNITPGEAAAWAGGIGVCIGFLVGWLSHKK